MEGKLQLLIDFYKKEEDPQQNSDPKSSDVDTRKKVEKDVNREVKGLTLQTTLFDPEDIYDFEFDENLSNSFHGVVSFKCKKILNLASADFDQTLVRISIGLKYEKKIVSQRWIWALIDTISYEGRQLFKNNKGEQEPFSVYSMQLVSPFAKLAGYHGNRSFVEKKIDEILKDLLSGYGEQEDSSVDLSTNKFKFNGLNVFPAEFFALDFSKLSDSLGIKNQTLLIQQGGESDLDFFNRLLISCGLNFTFVHKQDGCSIVFSDQVDLAPQADCYEVTTVSSDDTKIDFLENFHYSRAVNRQQNSQAHSETLYSNLLGSVTISSDRSGMSDLLKSLIKRNLDRRSGRSNMIFSGEVQNVGGYPGCILKLVKSEAHGGQLLIERSLLHANTLADTIFPLTHSVKGLLLATDDEECSFEELGSFAPEPAQITPSLSLHPAVVCDALGNVVDEHQVDVATDIDYGTKNTEEKKEKVKTVSLFLKDKALQANAFYAKLVPENTVVVVKTLPGAGYSGQTLPTMGAKIFLLVSGGAFYMYSYRQNDLRIESESVDAVAMPAVSEVFAQSHSSKVAVTSGLADSNTKTKEYLGKASIVFSRYNNVNEFIAEKIKCGSTDIEQCMAWLEVVSNHVFIAESYLDKYEDKVDAAHNVYMRAKKTYNLALEKFSNECKAIDLYLDDPNLIDGDGKNKYEKKIASIKENCKLDDARKDFKKASDDINSLATEMVTNLELNKLKRTDGAQLFGVEQSYEELKVSSSSNVQVSADNEVTIQGKRIVLTADEIAINSNNALKLYSDNSIALGVKAASISLKPDGATIFAPGTYGGYDVKQDESYNASNMLSSTLAVKGYSGIVGSAFNVSFGASNSLALKGSLGTGMSFGYGIISMTSERFNYISEGRRDLIANMAKYALTFTTDLGLSLGAKNKADVAIKNTVINTVTTFYDDVITGIDKTTASIGKIKNASSRSEKACSYIEAVATQLGVFLDYIYDICKIVYSAEDTINQEKEVKNNNQTEDKDKPYFLRKTDNFSISKLDQAKLYINYLKIVLNLTIAGVMAVEAGNGVTKSKVTRINISSGRVKIETPEYKQTTISTEEDNTPRAGEDILIGDKDKRAGKSITDNMVEELVEEIGADEFDVKHSSSSQTLGTSTIEQVNIKSSQTDEKPLTNDTFKEEPPES